MRAHAETIDAAVDKPVRRSDGESRTKCGSELGPRGGLLFLNKLGGMAMHNSMVLCAAALFGSSAMASDLPKQGTDSFTNVWVSTSNAIEHGNRTFVSYELDGVARKRCWRADV